MNKKSIYLPLSFHGVLTNKPSKFSKYLFTFGYCFSALDLIRRVFDIALNSSFNEVFSILDGDDYLFIVETVAITFGPILFPRENFISLDDDKFVLNRYGYNRYEIDLNEIIDFEENNLNRRKQVITFQKKNGDLIEVPWFKLAPVHTIEHEKQISSLFFEIRNRIAKNKSYIKE